MAYSGILKAWAGFSCLLAGAWAQLTPPCGDDFAAPSLSQAWSFADLDGSASGSHSVSGGRLGLTGRGRDMYGAVNEFVGVVRGDILGDFDVSVKIEAQTNSHAWAQAGIVAATDVRDLKKGGLVVLDVTPGQGYNFFYDSLPPAGGLDGHVSAGASAYPVWIRLAKSAGGFSAWYKNKAAAPWILIADRIVPLGAKAPSQIALMSLSHNVNMDATTVFDDFTCLHEGSTALRAHRPPGSRGGSGGFLRALRLDLRGRFLR